MCSPMGQKLMRECTPILLQSQTSTIQRLADHGTHLAHHHIACAHVPNVRQVGLQTQPHFAHRLTHDMAPALWAPKVWVKLPKEETEEMTVVKDPRQELRR